MGEGVTVSVVLRESIGAAALVRDGLAALVFFDILDEDNIAPDEIRIFNYDRSSVPEHVLARLLDSWEPMGEFSPFNVTAARDLPLGLLEKEAKARLRSERAPSDFTAPGPDEIDALLETPGLLGFRNVRDLRSHLTQIRAVQTYLEALERGDAFPMKAIAEDLDITPDRARRLIVFARKPDNGYLTRTGKAKAGGHATRRAHALSRAAAEALNRQPKDEMEQQALVEAGFSSEIAGQLLEDGNK